MPSHQRDVGAGHAGRVRTLPSSVPHPPISETRRNQALATDPELKRVIETVKLRVPIEDIVRERVPALKKSGARYWACCPFHEENTASFSVDPRSGLWYCFGACSMGGDQIHFLQRLDNLTFMEALEILAGRAGVSLPERRSGKRGSKGDDAGLRALAAVDEFFRNAIGAREGRTALGYTRERGLSANTMEAFGVGFAPPDGQALIRWARALFARRDEPCGFGPRDLERTGVIRRDDRGRPYSFFRGRLMIPIRDLRGRTVGFGGRRLVDGETAGPKYVNTPETDYFHKGRLIYGLDRAVQPARQSRHLILVEGYTDVMAAHQVGIQNVAAVLGTSTTDDHAALVRRSGARRVSLVFDGDEAGRRAAWKALLGLLPLELELEAVLLPSGSDPADLCLRDTSGEAFRAAVGGGIDWFDFVCSGLESFSGAGLAREVDRIFELLTRIAKPVHRESLLRQLAERMDVPLASLREQWRQLPQRRQERQQHGAQNNPGDRGAGQTGRQSAEAAEAAGTAGAAVRSDDQRPQEPGDAPKRQRPQDPRLLSAWRGIVGATLLDDGLIPLVRPWREKCPFDEIGAILDAILALYEEDEEAIDAQSVLAAMTDHPAREHVATLAQYAGEAEAPESLLSGELDYLKRRLREREKREILRRITELERASESGDEEAQRHLDQNLSRLKELSQLSPSTPPAGSAPSVLS